MDARTITVGDLAKLRKDARTALAACEEPPQPGFSVREVEAMLEAAHTNAREPVDDDELPPTIEAAVKWTEDLLGRPVGAAREDTERPDAAREEMLDLIERFRDLPENCAHHSSRRNRCRDEASTVLRKHGRLTDA